MTLYEDNTLEVDVQQAQTNGVSSRQLRTARKFETMHDRLIAALNVEERPAQSERYRGLQNWFEPYFRLVASGQPRKRVLPSSVRTGSALDTGSVGTLDGGCGGTREDPHDCPPYIPTTDGPWDSKGAVQDVLVDKGFHETEDYVNQYSGVNTSYTKVVSACGCSGGPFRTHGIIEEVSDGWLYKTQTPEPNPEVYNYVWPSADWATYVYWWHRSSADQRAKG